jgi:hypothetical protein
LTVPYDPNFDRRRCGAWWFYHGASLTALQRLGKKKGYGLVGCDSNGVNAFFVREDCLTKELTALSPQSAYDPIRAGWPEVFPPQTNSGSFRISLILGIIEAAALLDYTGLGGEWIESNAWCPP